MIQKNYESAKKNAQANADLTGTPWVIFKDTNGNHHIERKESGPSRDVVILAVYPVSIDHDTDSGWRDWGN